MDPELEAAIRRAEQAGGGGTSSTNPAPAYAGSSDDPMVYIGPGAPRSPYAGKELPGGERIGDAGTGPRERPLSDVQQDIYRMSPRERQKWADLLVANGIIEEGNFNFEDLVGAWAAATEGAANLYSIGGHKVTPTGYVKMMSAGMSGGSAAAPFDGKDKFSTTETVNSTNTDLSTKGEARAIIREAFQSELGRDPTRRESRAFFRALRKAEKRHPSRTTGTRSSSGVQTRQENGNSQTTSTQNDNTTTRGGVGPEFDANYVDDRYDSEMDSRRTATDYYAALLDLAGGGA
jgi:hypothetical protein